MKTLFLITFLAVTSIAIASPESLGSNDPSSPDLWETLSETTWKYDQGFSAESFIFYTDNLGNRKCIHQVFGSGCLVVGREYVEVEFLYNDLVRIDGVVFKFMRNNLMVSNSRNLILESRSPQVGWQRGGVDMEKVRSEGFDIHDITRE